MYYVFYCLAGKMLFILEYMLVHYVREFLLIFTLILLKYIYFDVR
jgi:hypothetical protein